MDQNKIKVGIIGFGRMGNKYLKKFRANGRYEVTYICDVNEEARNYARQESPESTIVDNENTVFNDPDVQVVALCTLANLRKEQIEKAVECGKHIISENSVFIAEKFYQSLTDEERQVVDDGVKLLCDTVTKIVTDQENSCADELRSYGITIYEPDMSKMRESVIAWYYDNPDSMKGWDMEILNQIINFGK